VTNTLAYTKLIITIKMFLVQASGLNQLKNQLSNMIRVTYLRRGEERRGEERRGEERRGQERRGVKRT
jgi:hypothetical protein